jgi:hypothetical protein
MGQFRGSWCSAGNANFGGRGMDLRRHPRRDTRRSFSLAAATKNIGLQMTAQSNKAVNTDAQVCPHTRFASCAPILVRRLPLR